MAGPDKEEPVSVDLNTKEIPVKASPPREKSPTGTESERTAPHVEPLPLSVPPPDGGWGWFVVLASFMIHIIGQSSAISAQSDTNLCFS